MSTTTRTGTPQAGEPGRQGMSGTAFVVACALAAAGLVAFFAFVSPILLERTRAAAPPPAPQEVAAGEVAAGRWTATAVERGPDEPCLAVEVASGEVARTCTGTRGPSLRVVEAVDLGGGAGAGGSTLVYGIVDARTTLVRFELAGSDPLEIEPAYVDFGFPLGFFATPLPAGDAVQAVEALDRDGERRASASCTHGEAGLSCRPDA